MTLLTKFLRAYFKTGWRGSFRLTDILSKRFESLQSILIETESGSIFGDLRISSCRGLLAYPKSTSGEDLVMRKFVKRGDIVFDVGAHLGFYTVLLSELVGESGEVYAVEPNRELLNCLTKTVHLRSNIKLFPVALSKNSGKVKLYVPEDYSMASLHNWTEGIAGEVHEVDCKAQKLDDLIKEEKIPHPNFIKCDVEGAELSVFGGAIETLNCVDAPVLLFEINSSAAKAFNKTSDCYFEFLSNLEKPGYNFFEVLPDRLKEVESTSLNYANILAIPTSKLNSCKEIS
ncbi:MAG: FkbM family methyltransferase [Pyrinomonadaceae bacterium]|nr:FkbM family methyltransferase [Pyrinomonadaceae bacterium]